MRALDRWKHSWYKRMIKWHFYSPKVITILDGGICSQMHQYLLGQLFAEHGYDVCYDLSFFKEWGSALNFHFVRNYDLLKAFPYLSLKQAPKTVVSIYKSRYYTEGNNTKERVEDFSFLSAKPPVYLGGYYHLPPELWLRNFQRLFKIDSCVLDKQNRLLFEEIGNKENSVGVHVRRGDLKVEIWAYGKPATIDYFYRAVRYMKDKLGTPYFYFFSDEPNWVSSELVSKLPLANNYTIVNSNGSEKGYMDLFLIARCAHQITSKGTMGKYGAVLMDNPHKEVILCDDETEHPWRFLLQNPKFL